MSTAALPGYQHVDHLGITVPDLDAAVDFYGRVPIELPEGPTAGCRCQYLKDPWGNTSS